jgi:hypothetical protein
VLELLLRNLEILFRLFDKRPSLGTSNRSQTAIQLTSYRRKKKNFFTFGALPQTSLCFFTPPYVSVVTVSCITAPKKKKKKKKSFRSGASLHQFGHQNMQNVHKLTEKVLRSKLYHEVVCSSRIAREKDGIVPWGDALPSFLPSFLQRHSPSGHDDNEE